MNTQQPVQGSLMGNPRAPMMQHNGPQSGPGLMNRPNNGSNMNLAGGGGLLNNPVRPMGMNSGNNGGIRPDWDGRSQHTMNSYNSGANPGPGLLNSYPMNNNAAAVAAAAAANMSSRNAQASSMQQSAPYQPYGSMPPQMAPNAAQNGSLLHQPPNMPYSGHMQQPATATPNHYQQQQPPHLATAPTGPYNPMATPQQQLMHPQHLMPHQQQAQPLLPHGSTGVQSSTAHHIPPPGTVHHHMAPQHDAYYRTGGLDPTAVAAHQAPPNPMMPIAGQPLGSVSSQLKLSDLEYQEAYDKNRTVSSSALQRALQDSANGKLSPFTHIHSASPTGQ